MGILANSADPDRMPQNILFALSSEISSKHAYNKNTPDTHIHETDMFKELEKSTRNKWVKED